MVNVNRKMSKEKAEKSDPKKPRSRYYRKITTDLRVFCLVVRMKTIKSKMSISHYLSVYLSYNSYPPLTIIIIFLLFVDQL